MNISCQKTNKYCITIWRSSTSYFSPWTEYADDDDNDDDTIYRDPLSHIFSPWTNIIMMLMMMMTMMMM